MRTRIDVVELLLVVRREGFCRVDTRAIRKISRMHCRKCQHVGSRSGDVTSKRDPPPVGYCGRLAEILGKSHTVYNEIAHSRDVIGNEALATDLVTFGERGAPEP